MILAVFALVILFPILWVLLLSVTSIPDANQNDIRPRTVEFGHYGYALRKIDTLPPQLRQRCPGCGQHGSDRHRFAPG